MPIRTRLVTIALSIAIASAGAAGATDRARGIQHDSGPVRSKRMPDGKQWTTDNLRVVVDGSFCYGDAESNCRRYGRLYTWEAAGPACRSLGDGWRLPTNEDWQQMAKHYGGVRDDSTDTGKAAFKALMIGGSAGFNVLLGGNRDVDGQYASLEAHGFYWSASETAQATAWLYNLGKGGQILNRHSDANKLMAVSVRCVSP